MPFVDVAPFGLFAIPHAISGGITEAATATQTGNTNKYAYMFTAPASGNITDIGFNVATLTTGGSVKVSVQTLDATTFFPTGTDWGTNTNVNVDISGGAGWYKATLTAAAAVNKGDLVAVVIEGVTSAVAPVYTLFCITDFTYPTTADIPMNASYAASAWSLIRTTPISMSIEYSGVCYPLTFVWPIKDTGSHVFNNTSTPDVYAVKFNSPVRLRFDGAWIWCDNDGDFTIKLYDSDGVTVLSSLAVDADVFGQVNAGSGQYFHMPEAVIEANKDYRLGIEPSTATSPTLPYLDFDQSYHLGQMRGNGISLAQSSAKDPSGVGSWTDLATRLPFITPQFNGIWKHNPVLVNGGLVQ